MEKFESIFDNPWEGISHNYPVSNKIYFDDDRFRVTFDTSGNYLFFVYDEENFKNEKNLPTFEFIDISVDHRKDESSSRLIFTLNNKEYFDNFNFIVKSIVKNSLSSPDLNAYDLAVNTFNEWTELFKKIRNIKDSEFIGLIGELYFFRYKLIENMNIAAALSSWVGPSNSKQDFIFGSNSFEIKTLMSSHPTTVKISSIDQLSSKTKNSFLVAIFMNNSEENSSESFSLEELINSTKGLMKLHIDRIDFESKINRFISRASSEQLNKTFVISKIEYFKVVDNFPRIIPNNVPFKEITEVKYSLNIQSLIDFKVAEDSISYD